jgi:hypothetical protein
VSGFRHIKIEEFIGKHAAANRGHTGHFIDQSMLIDGFCNQAMSDTMCTTWTIGEWYFS